MKKILFAAFMIFAAFFIASCAGEDEITNALGKSCAIEGEETCSEDSSQILICRDLSWQAKKNCNLNFGQYCRQTASGSYSCTDSGNTNEPTDQEPTNSEPTDQEPTNNDPTDQEPEDNDPTDQEPEDNDPSDDADTENEDNTDTENDDTEPGVQDLETCEDIVKCQKACTDNIQQCSKQCFNRGTTTAQNDLYERNQKCPNYTELDDLKHCHELYVKCGIKGDESYPIPYGHAVINGTLPYISPYGTTSFSQGEYISTFVLGSFGSNGNIPDPTASTEGVSLSAAYLNQAGSNIILRQSYTASGKNPDVLFIIDAHSPGTYSVGFSSKDNIQMIVFDGNQNEDDSCDHAFGYGYLELSGTGLMETYQTGAYTINIQGEVDLYSYKNAPMYIGSSNTGDITNENLVACQPK